MTHVLVRYASGRRRAYTPLEYALLPLAALLSSRARLGTRRDAIAWLVEAPR